MSDGDPRALESIQMRTMKTTILVLGILGVRGRTTTTCLEYNKTIAVFLPNSGNEKEVRKKK